MNNASTDGTRDYLEALQNLLPNLRVVFNPRNEGFARGNNIGMLRSRGDYIVLLNNDTVVTPGWLIRLVCHLEKDPKIWMVGPVTNSARNEQMIPATYHSLEELEAFAKRRAEAYKGLYFEIPTLAMFCVLFHRRLLDKVGLLDERFGLGTFEDDDFCHRVRSFGYKLICVEDVFVHHFSRGTTQGDDEAYLRLFVENRKKFKRKWGCGGGPPVSESKAVQILTIYGIVPRLLCLGFMVASRVNFRKAPEPSHSQPLV